MFDIKPEEIEAASVNMNRAETSNEQSLEDLEEKNCSLGAVGEEKEEEIHTDGASVPSHSSSSTSAHSRGVESSSSTHPSRKTMLKQLISSTKVGRDLSSCLNPSPEVVTSPRMIDNLGAEVCTGVGRDKKDAEKRRGEELCNGMPFWMPARIQGRYERRSYFFKNIRIGCDCLSCEHGNGDCAMYIDEYCQAVDDMNSRYVLRRNPWM